MCLFSLVYRLPSGNRAVSSLEKERDRNLVPMALVNSTSAFPRGLQPTESHTD